MTESQYGNLVNLKDFQPPETDDRLRLQRNRALAASAEKPSDVVARWIWPDQDEVKSRQSVANEVPYEITLMTTPTK